MGAVCPECGAEAAFVERKARVLQGSCVGCGRAFTIVQEAPSPVGDHAATDTSLSQATSEEGARPSPSEPPELRVPGPACAVCGATLTLTAKSGTSFEARCHSCSTTLTYVLATGPVSGPFRRGPPREDRPTFRTPRARPCRECGGPLSFSTDDDGNVTGECASCGNRFTLPPRRGPAAERAGRGYRGGRDRSFSPRFRRPGRWPRQAEGSRPRQFEPSRPSYRPRERRPGSDDDEEDRPRRRRPRRD